MQAFTREFQKRFHKYPNNNIHVAVSLLNDIFKEQNWRLTREPNMDEVWQVVKQIGLLKTPGSDGMHVIFIRNVGMIRVSLLTI